MADLDDRIPQMLQRVDLVAEVERRAGPSASCSGGTYTFGCPSPDHADNHPSFTVKDGRWRCWSQCDMGGDAIDLVVWLDRVPKAEAIERLAAQVGMARPEPPPAGHPNAPIDPRKQAMLDDLLDRFLEARKWEREITDQLGLHVVLDARGNARVRFPFRRGGADVYHQDRAIGDAEPRWLNPPGAIPCPYNADSMAASRAGETAFILEGVSDVVGLLHTFPDAVAVGAPGSGVFKRAWARAFTGLDVVLVGDNDPAGAKFCQRAEAILAPVAKNVVCLGVPEPHGDLDSWRQANVETFEIEMVDRADAVAGLLCSQR